jgi:hypothetical protein
MKLIYTTHLEFRLEIRDIPYDLPSHIFKHANEHYYDTLTKHYVALYKIKFEGKIREMALTYDRKKGAIEIITLHPIRLYQKIRRINSERWKKI